MGANIGTTITNTLVSIGHISRKEEFKRAIAGATVHDFFNLICVLIFFPLELATGFLQKLATSLTGLFINMGGIKFTNPIKTATKPAIHLIDKFFIEYIPISHHLGYILILILSFALLFIALYYIVKIMKSMIISRTETILDNIITKHGIIGIIAGLLFTIFVQSSSITTSLLVPMIGAGIISVELAFPLTLGANIGTTTTAILASFATGNPSAITIAFVHLLFNLCGVFFVYPVKTFRTLPITLAKKLGELTFKNRSFAFIYIFTVFFLIPISLIFISNKIK
jgi:sodium-dependent phosphate cotransporter